MGSSLIIFAPKRPLLDNDPMSHSVLQPIDFLDPNGNPIPGLVALREDPITAELQISETVALESARALCKSNDPWDLTYVFFRRFMDGRSSQIAAYVIDNTDDHLSKSDIAHLHRRVWLQGVAPLLYVAWRGSVDILSCARGPDFLDPNTGEIRYEPKPIDALATAGAISEQMRPFSAYRLADGTFWDDPAGKKMADHKNAAHQSLIDEMVRADERLDGANHPTRRRLLLLTILVKYLEDREVFPSKGWWGQRWREGAREFRDLLEEGDVDAVKRFLQFMEKKFNGDVFQLPDREPLTPKDLRSLAGLADSKSKNGQIHLWDLYSFKHIPIEIISHLYQRFTQGGKGAVYTPPFLAALILDQAMPYDDLTGKERVLDPSCGSGVFLVGAFRRLVNVWRSRNKWRRPCVDELKRILKRSIYGVELEKTALDLTVFSLSLAICDALQPEIIWEKLRFDRLRDPRDTNLMHADFFEAVLDMRDGVSNLLSREFDVIVGNPPFIEELSKPGRELDEAESKRLPERGKTPAKQAAYLFLEQALGLLRDGGRSCLLQPANFLYSSALERFRRSVFLQCPVEVVLDFASIRGLFQEAADPKVVGILSSRGGTQSPHTVQHWTFRRTKSTHAQVCFELDFYDQHPVSQEAATSDPHVWRTGLFGGGRLVALSRKLQKEGTLAEYLSSRVREDGWDWGEGFIVASTGRREKAPFLTGLPYLPSNGLTQAGIDKSRISTVEATEFRSSYSIERFSAPLVLIRKQASLPVAFWETSNLAYRASLIGVHAPTSKSADLRRFYRYLRANHDLCRFCCMLHGSRVVSGKQTAILKQDIDNIVCPPDLCSIPLPFWEQVLIEDVLEWFLDYANRGHTSKLLTQRAQGSDMAAYTDIFIRMLGTIYDELAAAEPIFLDGLTCQPFYFGDKPDLEWLRGADQDHAAEQLRNIIYQEDKHACLRTIRVLRFYTGNVLLVVKPDRLRYWIRSTAIRDADEALADLESEGY